MFFFRSDFRFFSMLALRFMFLLFWCVLFPCALFRTVPLSFFFLSLSAVRASLHLRVPGGICGEIFRGLASVFLVWSTTQNTNAQTNCFKKHPKFNAKKNPPHLQSQICRKKKVAKARCETSCWEEQWNLTRPRTSARVSLTVSLRSFVPRRSASVGKQSETFCSAQLLFHACYFCWYLDEQPRKLEYHKGSGSYLHCCPRPCSSTHRRAQAVHPPTLQSPHSRR